MSAQPNPLAAVTGAAISATPIGTAFAIVNLLVPLATNLILTFRHPKTGAITLFAQLDAIEAQEQANQDIIKQWVGTHPAPAP